MRPDRIPPEEPAPRETNGSVPDKSTLELVFITVTGVLVVCAFITALTYEGSSGIAPLCIMVPLLVLIGFQFRRTLRASRVDRVVDELTKVVRGGNRVVNGALMFTGWMAVLLGLIFLAGHYAGIAVFMFVMLRGVSRESTVMSASVSISVTLLIYLLFEYAFRIEMYRGLLERWF